MVFQFVICIGWKSNLIRKLQLNLVRLRVSVLNRSLAVRH